MFQAIKVWVFRKYYRFISAWNWRGYRSDIHWGALEIPSADAPIHGRIYNSAAGADKPLIIYFHGGGWTIGDLDTHHHACLNLADRCDCTVIAIDYRLAPEHPFPAGPKDCLAAVNWIADHLGDFGPSNGKLVLAGGSAGANLSAITCMALDDKPRSRVSGALMLYPSVDHYSRGFPSHIERATGGFLTTRTLSWFWDIYLAGADPKSPQTADAFPLRSNKLSTMPPTLVVTAELDPLRDDGIAFSDKLREAGVPVQYRHFDTADHDFACTGGPNGNCLELMRNVADWLPRL
jgi:acetyl esterase